MNKLILAAALFFSAVPLLASADLSVTNTLTTTVFRAGTSASISYSIHNAGPDPASNVIVRFSVVGATAFTPCSDGCSISDIPAGQSRSFFDQLTFPATAGQVTMTASVASSATDPNLADNSVTSTVTVSTDPDVYLSISAPLRLDLGLPFLVTISLGNFSQSVAHDVDVTVDFRTDAGVQTLPAGCTNPVHGRIICHLDTLVPGEFPGQPNFAVTLIAPSTFESGSIVLTAKATEREQDFNPSSNSWTTAPQLYNTFYVTSTANDGTGSLRQAILDANASTNEPRAIGFRIEEPSPTPWKTIRITSPLPAITASGGVRVEGGIQSRFLGDTNPDGPEIEISGEGSVDGDGLLITDCATEIANLVINGFRRNGISAIATSTGCLPFPELHHLFIGTDPTGSEARPNGQRGIGISVPNGTDINQAGGGADIHDCVISGNALSGIFDLSGRLNVWGNRIGVKAGSDEPLTNGASGIFIGTGGWGSAIGPDILTSSRAGNVIAFNREMGVAIATGTNDVSVRGNRIWSNGGLGIDVGLDGPTLSVSSEFGLPVGVPTLTVAHYDPASGKTIVEGDTARPPQGVGSFTVDLYSNDVVDPSGFGEGQRPVGTTQHASFSTPTHFRVDVAGDLTGQFITAASTRTYYVGFAKPEGIDQGFLTQTSEFSRAIEVR